MPPVDYYGTTPWHDADSGLYFQTAVRFWHWQCVPWDGPGTKDLALMTSRDGDRWQFVSRAPVASPSADGTASSRQVRAPLRAHDSESERGGGASSIHAFASHLRSTPQVWLAPPGPVRVGEEDLYFLTGRCEEQV